MAVKTTATFHNQQFRAGNNIFYIYKAPITLLLHNHIDYKEARKKTQSIFSAHQMRCLCLKHHVLPQIYHHINANKDIDNSLWSCQCVDFKSKILKGCTLISSTKLRGLIQQCKPGVHKKKHPGGYYAEISVEIDGTTHSTELFSWTVAEIKKLTQPKTRLDRIGVATFPGQSIIRSITPSCFLEFKFKDEYRQEIEKINDKDKHLGYKGFWYKSWAANGIMECWSVDNNKYEYTSFVSVHVNPYYGDESRTTRESCEERIEVNIYLKQDSPKINTLKINGIPLIKHQKQLPKLPVHNIKEELNAHYGNNNNNQILALQAKNYKLVSINKQLKQYAIQLITEGTSLDQEYDRLLIQNKKLWNTLAVSICNNINTNTESISINCNQENTYVNNNNNAYSIQNQSLYGSGGNLMTEFIHEHDKTQNTESISTHPEHENTYVNNNSFFIQNQSLYGSGGNLMTEFIHEHNKTQNNFDIHEPCTKRQRLN